MEPEKKEPMKEGCQLTKLHKHLTENQNRLAATWHTTS